MFWARLESRCPRKPAPPAMYNGVNSVQVWSALL
jgi:hypothetical protein